LSDIKVAQLACGLKTIQKLCRLSHC